MKKITFLFLIVLIETTPALSTNAPFSRGVNLSTWFQETKAKQIQFSKYTKTDFENIKLLGCDVIRLPINLHEMTSGSPNYTVDPLLFGLLDQAVDWAEDLSLHIILDNHSFDPTVNTSPSIGTILVPVWKQIAEHMKNRSNLVYYEILNEPHGITDSVWNSIQKKVIDSIRTIDTLHTIIVGPANWNSPDNLAAMPVYADTNLIYTFHFYEPFIFTHQGASWTDPSMVPLSGVPFPYDAARMPSFPAALIGTWVQTNFNNYSSSGTTVAVKNLIDNAVSFKNSRNVRLYAGEFGVYIPNSINEDRVRWYDLVRQYFEEKGIAWTTWDYQGGFGLFEQGTNEFFEYDLNIPMINALGLIAPPQNDFSVVPDTVGFHLYKDYYGPHIDQSSYPINDNLDFYSVDSHVEGTYCIRWNNAAQYDHLGFDFIQIKDLSLLKNTNYVLDFWIRSSSPGIQFDVRFVDTKTGSTDHPWRIRKTITSSDAAWDGVWHQVRIPLNNFIEQGSWDSTWYNPVGLFDWSAIDLFEIVAEENSLLGKEMWLDKIQITTAVPVPVELTSFIATSTGLNTSLHWKTATEVNNYGFEIERKTINDWKKIGFVEGAGTVNIPKEYSYSDKHVLTGKYSYRLKQIDRDGTFIYSNAVETIIDIKPTKFELAQNYPNPFNPSTTFLYQLPHNAHVSLQIYNMLGQRIESLVDGRKEAGTYQVRWTANLSGGVYFYRLQADDFVQTRKFLLVK